VWDGTGSIAFGQFLPSQTYLLDYLRYFDQYARSMTPWAPDGSAFTYAGEGKNGARGVWVQPASPNGAAVRIGDGVYAAWSPR
jgi:TolB protein